MNEILKNVVNKTIEKEYKDVQCRFLINLKRNKKSEAEYLLYSLKSDNLKSKLQGVLPKEYHEVLDELENALNVVSLVETEIAFKAGVLLGVTELKYLSEVGDEIYFI